MIAGMTYYQICWFFLLYSFLGWITEVIFYAVTEGNIINRGFLSSPVCPVYGFGVISVFAAVNHFDAAAGVTSFGESVSIPLVFFGGMVLATTVELIAGWGLDRLFHARWWDYSDKPLNLNGYICLEFSIMWGFAITFVIKLFHPQLLKEHMDFIPHNIGWIGMAIIYLILLVDLIVTVAVIVGFNKQLEQLDSIRKSMLQLGDRLSGVIGKGTLATTQSLENGKNQAISMAFDFKDAASNKIGAVQEAASAKIDAVQEAATATISAVQEAAAATISAVQDAASARLDEVQSTWLEFAKITKQEVSNVVPGSPSEKEAEKEASDDEAKMREEMEQLEEKEKQILDKILSHKLFGAGRLVRAFPRMVHDKYSDMIKLINERLKNKK